ncbi:MAG: IPT/TIG domain-containing protein [Verrucomicrobiota bacterium]
MKRLLSSLFAAGCLLVLAGCNLTVTNLTPSSLPANPSRIYTLTTRVNPKGTTIIKESVRASIVIDGRTHAMSKSALGSDIYEFDYQLPAGRDEIAYYFLVNYNVENNGVVAPREEYTKVIHSKIVGRYVFSLETNRGPVGARISIVGRGFTKDDVVSFDGTPVRTEFESSNAIAFYVPSVTTGANYGVTLSGPAGTSPVGTFRVDASELSVSPSSLDLVSGSDADLTFTLSSPAAEGGQLLDVTTDIPDSVIMPEVVVPAGETSVTVSVKGGVAGSGNLFLKGYGSGEVVIPVTVR